MDEGSQPPAVGGVRNVQFGVNRLVIPIGGGNPHKLIEPRLASDNEDLKKQKYDWQVAEKSSSAARFVAGVTAKPSWIVGPRVFIDRREKRWVKCWYFDVEKLIASGNRDSIFYLADTTTRFDRGTTKREMINAFAIINSAKLPRNMTIASVNSIYQIGDFNGPVNPADSNSYYNAQVAGDAYTLISPQWWDYTYEKQGVAGSLEQAYDSLRNWLPNGASERWTGRLGTYNGTIRVHAALVSGNKQTDASAYPPINDQDRAYEQRSEGGWHNTIRFREDLGPAITVFKGSFICLWAAQGPYLNPQMAAYNTGFYAPPQRLWGFDTQFKDLNNMPPATPFLSSATMANWLEKR